MVSLEAVAYPAGVASVVLFGLFALILSFWRHRTSVVSDTAEFFLTARNSVNTFTIAWSFYAGAMGSWALFGPPSYCLYAGVLGTVMYSVASGLPIIVIGYFGSVIHEMVPNVMGLGDFTNRRFGRIMSLYVGTLTLFNMGIAMTAEYTAVGDLYATVINSARWPIVVIIGVVSIMYTAAGGLYVSIITDQWQALVSVLVVLIIFIYVAVTFDGKLGSLPNNYLDLGYDLSFSNYLGYAAIAVMPISLTSATIFSEAMWQRCWASADKRTLRWGSIYGCFAVIAVVFLFGFGGILAVWGGVWVPADDYDYGNTVLFSLLSGDRWVLVLVCVMAVTMSESAVDSLQNAIVDTMSVTFVAPLLRWLYPSMKLPVIFIRLLVLVLNAAPIVVALQGYNILQLFLLANLITTTSTIPLLMGIIPGRAVQKWVTPFSALSGCFIGLSSLFWWAKVKAKEGESYSSALHTVFLVAYDYPPFLLALGFSIVGMALGALLEFLARRVVPGWREYPFYDLAEDTDARAFLANEEKQGKEVYTTTEEKA